VGQDVFYPMVLDIFEVYLRRARLMADEQWHLEKKVPIGIIVTIIVQTMILAYFLGDLSSQVTHNTKKITTLELVVSPALQERNATNIQNIKEQLANLRVDISKMDDRIQRRYDILYELTNKKSKEK
jgi:Tfp pilus assembly protein PilO